jgi:Serine dehydrogenase proteinase
MHFWDAIWIFFILQLAAAGRAETAADVRPPPGARADRDAARRDRHHADPPPGDDLAAGIPLVRHIEIDDAESVLRAIRGTPQGRAIRSPTSSAPAARGSASRRRIATSSATPSGTCWRRGGHECSASGLLSGGYGEDELTGAGAFRVYRDAEELRTSLDELGVLA